MASNLQLKPHADFSDAEAVGQVPPHSLEAEQSVLGAILIDNEAINAAIEVLRPEDFYQGSHGIIFDCMSSLQDKGDPIDIISLHEELARCSKAEVVGGSEYLSHLLDIVPTAANTQFYARVIKEMSLRRKVISEANSIATEAFNGRGEIDKFIDSVEQRIFKVSESRLNQGFIRIGDIVRDSITRIDELFQSDEPITCLLYTSPSPRDATLSRMPSSA